jgi:hypothetical protein
MYQFKIETYFIVFGERTCSVREASWLCQWLATSPHVMTLGSFCCDCGCKILTTVAVKTRLKKEWKRKTKAVSSVRRFRYFAINGVSAISKSRFLFLLRCAQRLCVLHHGKQAELWRQRNGVHSISEDCSILECDTSLGQQFPTFRRIVVLSSSAASSLRRVSLMCHHHQVTSRTLSRTWRYSDQHAILLRFRQVQGGRRILKMTACLSETSPINQTTRPQSGLSPSSFIQCGFQM